MQCLQCGLKVKQYKLSKMENVKALGSKKKCWLYFVFVWKGKFQIDGDSRGKVGGSHNVLGFMLWRPGISIGNCLVINQLFFNIMGHFDQHGVRWKLNRVTKSVMVYGYHKCHAKCHANLCKCLMDPNTLFSHSYKIFNLSWWYLILFLGSYPQSPTGSRIPSCTSMTILRRVE